MVTKDTYNDYVWRTNKIVTNHKVKEVVIVETVNREQARTDRLNAIMIRQINGEAIILKNQNCKDAFMIFKACTMETIQQDIDFIMIRSWSLMKLLYNWTGQHQILQVVEAANIYPREIPKIDGLRGPDMKYPIMFFKMSDLLTKTIDGKIYANA